jgi:hypothetical protein
MQAGGKLSQLKEAKEIKWFDLESLKGHKYTKERLIR